MSDFCALEISKQYLKIASANAAGNKSNISKCMVEPISSLTDEQISHRLLEILRREKLKPKSISICMPRDLVTVRNLHLPSQDHQEIVQMIDLHIARVVPYKKEEIIFSYKLAGIDEMGYSRVVLAIIQIDILRRQARFLEQAGYLTDNISLSSYELFQWAVKNYSSEMSQNDLYAVLDIDSVFTDFIVFSKQDLLFTRSIPLGTSPFTEAGGTGLMKLLGELKQSLVIFYNEAVNKRPIKIFLTGGNYVEGIVQTIEKEMEIPVKYAPVPCAKNIPQDVSMAAVSGLSVNRDKGGLNFSLPELQVKKVLKEKTKDLFVMGSCFIYLFTIICAIFLGRIYKQQSYLAELNKNLGVIGDEAENLIIQSKVTAVVKDYIVSRKVPLAVMFQLQQLVSQEIAVTSVAIDEGSNITLRGQALQLSDVFKFINFLEKSGAFKDVQSQYTRKRKAKDKEITDFEITFKLAG